jgi:large subunit ribosomal protein L29
MNATEMRDMTDTEIRERIEEIQEELFKLRFRSATQQLENPTLLKSLRRDLARLKTIQTERSSAGEE